MIFKKKEETQPVSNKLLLSPQNAVTLPSNALILGDSSVRHSFVEGIIKNASTSPIKNFVIFDNGSHHYSQSVKTFEEFGYKVQKLDFIHLNESSVNYNPLAHIKNNDDITLIAETIVEETENDIFWCKTERALLSAVIGYTNIIANEGFKNFASATVFLREMVGEAYQNISESKSYKSMVEFCKKDPNSFVASQWAAFCTAAGKTGKSIILSLLMKLKLFETNEVKALTNTDNIAFNFLDKTALFVTYDKENTTYDTIIKLFCTQLCNSLTSCAIDNNASTLLIMNEAHHFLSPSLFCRYISLSKGYNVSFLIGIKTITQFKEYWEHSANIMLENINAILCYNATDEETLSFLRKIIGNAPIQNKIDNNKNAQLSQDIVIPKLKYEKTKVLALIMGEQPTLSKA